MAKSAPLMRSIHQNKRSLIIWRKNAPTNITQINALASEQKSTTMLSPKPLPMKRVAMTAKNKMALGLERFIKSARQ